MGFINCYHTVWFLLTTGKNELHISEPIRFSNTRPSVLKSFAFAIKSEPPPFVSFQATHLGWFAENRELEESDDEPLRAEGASGLSGVPGDDAALLAELPRFDIAHLTLELRSTDVVQQLGAGRAGIVIDLDGVAVKSVEMKSNLLCEVQFEAKLYATLQALQEQHLIPNLLYAGSAVIHTPRISHNPLLSGPWLKGTRYALMLTRVGCTLKQLAPWQRTLVSSKAVCALEALHRAGWLWGDVELKNCALSNTRDPHLFGSHSSDHVVLLDLGLASRPKRKQDLEVEIRTFRQNLGLEAF
jgi:hypothetical protein